MQRKRQILNFYVHIHFIFFNNSEFFTRIAKYFIVIISSSVRLHKYFAKGAKKTGTKHNITMIRIVL